MKEEKQGMFVTSKRGIYKKNIYTNQQVVERFPRK